jgi:hypothetical protein
MPFRGTVDIPSLGTATKATKEGTMTTEGTAAEEVAKSLWWGAALWVGSVALAVVLAIVIAPEADATGSDTVIEHTFIGY